MGQHDCALRSGRHWIAFELIGRTAARPALNLLACLILMQVTIARSEGIKRCFRYHLREPRFWTVQLVPRPKGCSHQLFDNRQLLTPFRLSSGNWGVAGGRCNRDELFEPPPHLATSVEILLLVKHENLLGERARLAPDWFGGSAAIQGAQMGS